MKCYGGRYLDSAELRDLGVGAAGDDVRVHSTCLMVGLENIFFGNHIRVDGFCSLIAGDGRIRLGDHIHIGAYVLLSGNEGIELADFVSLSHGVRIHTRSDDYTGEALTGPTVPDCFLKVKRGPVRLGRHALIGSGSVVLPGCDIGEGTSVGALSLVGSSLPGWGMYFGAPVRRVGDRRRDVLALEKRVRAEEAR